MASAEVSPFARTGGLGDVLGSLPKALAAHGHDVTVFTPFYRQTREYFQHAGAAPDKLGELVLTWGGFTSKVTLLRSTVPESDVTMIFVMSDELFDRPALYSNRSDGYEDHIERFTVFCRAVLGAFAQMNFEADILHAHDWHAALLPVYFRFHPATRRIATVYTIHNLNYQGRYGPERFIVLGLEPSLFTSDTLEFHGDVNLMKGGIVFADQVTTVSPTYSREIQTPEFGAGLDGVLRAASFKLSGILNGIDVDEWDARTDSSIVANFNSDDFSGKRKCKQDLRKLAKLNLKNRGLLVGAVSRLVEQKGFDLFVPIMPRLLELDAQVVVLGSGQPQYEDALREVERQHPGDLRAFIRFDPALAHKIIAGCDVLVIPSHYEPCGLNQMYSLRYGTLPVVRMTGGLADTVRSYDGTNADEANGFGFSSTSARDLLRELFISTLIFKDRLIWKRLQLNGMAEDFSWDASAKRYEQVYEKAIASH